MTKGLTNQGAQQKLDSVGKNKLEDKDQTTRFDVLKRQFNNFLVWILMVAAFVSFLAGKALTFYFIVVIVGIIILMGYLQEWKAEEAMQKLEEMTQPEVEVYRGGKIKEVPSDELVPGDVIKVRTGDKIPADAEITESTEIKVNEAILTGESKSVSKDESDELYSGTTVVHGRGEARITKTGMDTELGKIADEIQQEDEETPLQKKIDALGKKLALIAVFVSAGIFGLGYLQGAPVAEILIVTLALTVATVPEALPLTITLTLSMGMKEMAEKNAIVKKMLAVEGLGSTTVICTDKTGTLTRNEMTVKKIHTLENNFDVEGSGYNPEGQIKTNNGREADLDDDKALQKLVEAGTVCNNTQLVKEEGSWGIEGEPTEGALTVLGKKIGLSKEEFEEEKPRLKEILFTSERKMMTTINKETEEEAFAYSKGAPEVILEKCNQVYVEGEKKELTQELKQQILNKNDEYAEDALRVLGFAYKENVSEPYEEETVENNLTFLGLAGMIDPPRKEVEQAIETCEKAGINIKMVTGDNPKTAKAIAQDIGLTENPEVMTGQQIEEMTEAELEEKVPDVDIYARTHPEHKLAIVNALKEDGEIVAMTGDGVNDAPAVKKADVGIGMGQKGTDVTKEASDMILEDDNFNTIVTAVKDGRKIYDNIEKFTTYLISRNFTEIIIIAMGITLIPLLLGASGFELLPLIALQILFINVIGEELPAISLGLDPATQGIMDRPPRDPQRELLNNRNLFIVVSMAAFMALTGFIIFLLGQPEQNLERARTMAFASIVLMVIVHTFNFRSLTDSILKIDPLENKLIILSSIAVLPLTLALIYIPQLAEPFTHTPITTQEWTIAAIGALATFIFIEIIKKLANKHFETA